MKDRSSAGRADKEPPGGDVDDRVAGSSERSFVAENSCPFAFKYLKTHE